uniref:multifunctional oxoglutarate decarboxylase/oxoglutarate dehydrogenase thiamine pyrophosphate-binding subunit/dihydrolipoyllysine-residue succinyltransferase subunit n=1 Tax=Virgisporangium aurantiacum TaxID=175570 RepID=UPI0035710DD8
MSSSAPSPAEDFGVNAWLVEEIYRNYLADPASVDETWRGFFDTPCLATVVREVPATLLAENRFVINRDRRGTGRGRVSVVDLVGHALVHAVRSRPGGNASFRVVDGRPAAGAGTGPTIAVGPVEVPARYRGLPRRTLAASAIGPVLTVTATFDRRVVEASAAAELLRAIEASLLGEGGFYGDVFASLGVAHQPVRWPPPGSARRVTGSGRAVRVARLIEAYRAHGHLAADLDPLRRPRPGHADLDPAAHGLAVWDLRSTVDTEGVGGRPRARLRDLLAALRDRYCGTVGVEYTHLADPERRRWIETALDRRPRRPDRGRRLRILDRLTAAESLELFLHTRYPGQRRFSLEGGESAVVLLDEVLGAAADAGLAEVAVGMSHRGRLTLMATVLGLPYQELLRRFEGRHESAPAAIAGDVKYNLGARTTFVSPSGGRTELSLLPNASHLEAVYPVVEGFARGRQDARPGGPFDPLPVVLHGDAAFAGQGVVAETLNLSGLRGFRTGGTIHVVLNNQIGFTTAPADARGGTYPTAAARTADAPVLHVNADDPEACAWVARLAFAYRQAFHRDVVIDLVCYRRRGHNESDDPTMTQPDLYRLIEARPPVRALYTDLLVRRGDLTTAEAEALRTRYRQRLERAVPAPVPTPIPTPVPDAAPAEPAPAAPVVTAIDDQTIKLVAQALAELPAGVEPHPRVAAQLQRRAATAVDGVVDWPMAETLAFGSLLLDGRPVRLTGEDSRRGTFAQRHHVLVDRSTGAEHPLLSRLSPDQARYAVYDSPLSEFAVLGFEYGYSVARPDSLVIWEAQFGDFANGAQTVIDEYVAAGEQRWGQRSGLCLLLPHGLEGQGPNHSSARVERFLQLCAQDNLTVAMPSLPSSYFHLLRRQALAPEPRPLVVFTPKSMLRLRDATSSVRELTDGHFRAVVGDPAAHRATTRRILLCSGKLAWDLEARRARTGGTDTAVVRIERLYPVPLPELAAELSGYPAGAEVRWVQEEPENQGAWRFLRGHLPAALGGRPLRAVTPPAAATTGTASPERHATAHRHLVERAFR